MAGASTPNTKKYEYGLVSGERVFVDALKSFAHAALGLNLYSLNKARLLQLQFGGSIKTVVVEDHIGPCCYVEE